MLYVGMFADLFLWAGDVAGAALHAEGQGAVRWKSRCFLFASVLLCDCIMHFTGSCPKTMGSCPKTVIPAVLPLCFSFEESLYLWLNMHPTKSWTACFTLGPLMFLWHLVRGMSVSGLWTAEACSQP